MRDRRPAWTRGAHRDEMSVSRWTRTEPAVARAPEHQPILANEPCHIRIDERTGANRTVRRVLDHPCCAAIGRVLDDEIAHAPYEAAARVASAEDDAAFFGGYLDGRGSRGLTSDPRVSPRERLALRHTQGLAASCYEPLSFMRSQPQIPADIDEHRDERWRREGTRSIGSAFEAERFIEQVGFAACLTDSRRSGPSLYIAVCGRRDAMMPRHVQKDPESSLTWQIKDELIRRGKVYYAKLARGKATFIAPRMVPYFHAVWGVRKAEEPRRLSRNAQAVLRVLRREWEMSTGDLRDESGVRDRPAFTRAIDELQAAMIVIPSAVYYLPKLTYIWTLAVGRFPDPLRRRVSRDSALREIARCFLAGAGMTIPGELARVTGLSRPEAGLGNHALVSEGYATRLAPGVYQLVRESSASQRV